MQAKSDGSLAGAGSEESGSLSAGGKVRSRSLEPLTGLAMWSSEPQIIGKVISLFITVTNNLTLTIRRFRLFNPPFRGHPFIKSHVKRGGRDQRSVTLYDKAGRGLKFLKHFEI